MTLIKNKNAVTVRTLLILTVLFLLIGLNLNGQTRVTLLQGTFCEDLEDGFLYKRCYTFDSLNFEYEYITDAYGCRQKGTYSLKKSTTDTASIIFHFKEDHPIPYNAFASQEYRKINKYEKLPIKIVNSDTLLIKLKENDHFSVFKKKK